jgi:hypothetical protein
VKNIVRIATLLAAATSSQLSAAEVQFTGRVLHVQGHVMASCRMIQIRRDSDGATFWFRIPDTGSDNSILAVALSALTTGLVVQVAYDTTIGSGCGTEPRIGWIGILSNN